MSERDVFGRAAVPALTATESEARDRSARESDGIPERLLMENAGRSAALIVDRLWPEGRIVAIVGSGHNGGDGLVLLRTMRAWGREVAYISAGSRAPDPALGHGHEIPALEIDPARAGSTALAVACAGAEVLIDALLGTGSHGAPREEAAAMITALNQSGRPVVALDLPSGVDPTTGEVPGPAVRADLTITFGAPKRGLMLQPARAYCGRLVAVEIGFPPEPDIPGCEIITPGWAAARSPKRPADAYKSTSGRLLVVAGRTGMAGAALIAAEAALRAGAGYLWLASENENRVPLQAALPEAIFVDRADRAALRTAALSADALLIGPGIGVDDVARSLLTELLATMAGKPALLDADALTLLGDDEAALRNAARGRDLVLTPHPGEMRRLTGLEVHEIRADPVRVAREFSERVGTERCALVLKGMPSIVAAAGEPVLINSVGSSDLARAGMGDQLAGVVAAFLAAGVEPRTAAGLGLFYAGRAADLAARGRSLGPRDISEELDCAFADPGPSVAPLGLPFITFDQPARW